MLEPSEEALDLLSCELDVRPVGAPGIDELAALGRGVTRGGEALVVSFDADALDTVERFAAAEQQCCPTISWTFESSADAVRLRIGAEPAQMDLLEQMFRSARS